MDAFRGLALEGNTWSPIAIDDYKERIVYDPNGNILDYERNGAPAVGKPTAMDKMHYHYYAGSNKLQNVSDEISANNYTEDINEQTQTDNYKYDAIGNLTDDYAENVTQIKWTVYGKISSLNKNGTIISYTYDAAGNRITKSDNDYTTLYVRDASGNVLSVYKVSKQISKEVSFITDQTELHLYGSSRLGMWLPSKYMTQMIEVNSNFGLGLKRTFTRGKRSLN